MNKEHLKNAQATACRFKVGDRVAIYTTDDDGGPMRRIGVVSEIYYDGTLGMQDDAFLEGAGYDISVAHPKQCRRLVKKPRREWLARMNPHQGRDGTPFDCSCDSKEIPACCKGEPCVRVVEKKEKRK